MDERLKKQLDFILEIDKEKNILRQTHLSDHGRRENDAEHAWHMAIMAYLLKEYSIEPIDVAKVMLMCLINDVVEIDADSFFRCGMYVCACSCTDLHLFVCKWNPGNCKDRYSGFPAWPEMETVE